MKWSSTSLIAVHVLCIYSDSDMGTLSDFSAEVASVRIHLQAGSVVRAVVRVSTSFASSSVSRAQAILLGGVRGSATAKNAASDALIYTLCTRQTG